VVPWWRRPTQRGPTLVAVNAVAMSGCADPAVMQISKGGGRRGEERLRVATQRLTMERRERIFFNFLWERVGWDSIAGVERVWMSAERGRWDVR
jgi:hypothetical protein